MSDIKRNLFSLAAVMAPLLLPVSSQAQTHAESKSTAPALQQEAKTVADTILAAERKFIREVAVGVSTNFGNVKRPLSDPELYKLYGNNYPNMRGAETTSPRASLGDGELYAMYGNNYPAMLNSQKEQTAIVVPPAAADGWVAGGYLQTCRLASEVVDVDPFDVKSFIKQEQDCVAGFSIYANKTGHAEEAVAARQ